MRMINLLKKIFYNTLNLDVIYLISKFLPKMIKQPSYKKIKYKTQRCKFKYHYHFH